MTDSALNAINHAAAQNDRWLFIGVLVVLGLFTVFVFRHIISENARLVADYKKSTEDHELKMAQIIRDQSANAVNLAEVITRNSEVVKNCGEIMEGCSAELRLCREQQNHSHR